MTDNFIKLNESEILRLKIKTSDGKDTGDVLEFDLEDIELPLKYQELLEKDKKNRENLRNQVFFKKEVEIYNIFLGENGVQKLLHGRKLGWTSLQEIDEIIEKQITPYLNVNMKSITDKVKEKYGEAVNRNKEVLKADE